MTPSTSVIMPAFNAVKYIATAIGSVQSQTVADWELVIVDDGSTDETLRVAREFASSDSRIRVHQQSNSGPSVARNMGFQFSSAASATLLFLDADDVLRPGAVETLRAVLNLLPAAGVVHGLASFIDETGISVRPGESEAWTMARRVQPGRWVASRLEPWEPLTLESLLCCNSIQTPGTALIRRDAFTRAEGFDPGIRITEDWDLWIRLSEQHEIQMVPHVVLDYRVHASSFSANTAALHEAERVVRRKTLANLGHRSVSAERAMKRYQRRLALSKLPMTASSLRRGDIRGAAWQLAFAFRHLSRTLGLSTPFEA